MVGAFLTSCGGGGRLAQLGDDLERIATAPFTRGTLDDLTGIRNSLGEFRAQNLSAEETALFRNAELEYDRLLRSSVDALALEAASAAQLDVEKRAAVIVVSSTTPQTNSSSVTRSLK